jgi:hypothetical protein
MAARLNLLILVSFAQPTGIVRLLTSVLMLHRLATTLAFFLFFPHGCFTPASDVPVKLKYRAVGSSPQVIALYEAWFGHPRHISVGYSSHDPAVIKHQIESARAMGISAFVVDWYGDREPFIDQSYAVMQKIAAKNDFKVAMMYDETDHQDDATDEAIADFTMFHETYLSAKAEGHDAYLTYQGRPLIFVFPKGGHTHWDKVRALVNTWNPVPLLIQENLPGQYANDFDGYYAWISPGDKGWAPDGSNWGQQYLSNFYDTMKTKYPDKMIVGGAWSTFDDSKASWGLNRHIAARCGQTFQDTFNFWRKELPTDQPPPFIMVETWNDYEEGTAVEKGIPSCGKDNPMEPVKSSTAAPNHQSANGR